MERGVRRGVRGVREEREDEEEVRGGVEDEVSLSFFFSSRSSRSEGKLDSSWSRY